MTESRKMTTKEVANEKAKRMMEGVSYWGAFYRKNPQRFCKDYLNIHLKLFQKILLYAMMCNNYFMFCASRGLGKTWLTALFCVVRCILFPGTKICVASSTRVQANEVLLKITDDFCKNYDWGSDLLNNEISNKSVGQNNAVIEFKNGSWIRVVTASDNGRGARANILIVDEFRMVDLDVINTVLRKFLTAPRTPGYLTKKEYEHLVERNKEIYMSSCFYKSHWSFEKAKAYVVNFLDATKKYFICGLPYQIAIKENLLSREQVEDEMSEADFDETKFSMEMGAMWYGDTGDAFFSFDDVSKRRKLKTAMYPPSSKYKVPDLAINERRILSVDIALMASKKKKNNDASSLIINSCIPTGNNNYISNIVYSENHEGLTTDELGLIVMRLYYSMKCTDIAIDTNGIGLGVYDFIIKDQLDPDTGETYAALSCCNNKDMEDRCKIKNAPKVVWSIKANQSFNNEMCTMLRAGFKNGKINLLVSEFEAEEILRDKIKGFSKLSIYEQTNKKMPYIQTTLLIYELIKLNSKINGNSVKIEERSGERKDRYSSLGYNYWVARQIEIKQKPQNNNKTNIRSITSHVRKPKIYSN
ncbi:hypothetical protein FMM80_00820 [Schaedlerella arabinosiphila]|uniref:Terminase n=1 Tax=Schaedlerella arabinosiphila TaxID=2044587 RepID=A0A9X5C3S0_9FIRM|nr:terminase family protein [Schaedlerella arabinosiphila]KAI4438959.1 hypothetical protein C824_001445 [Schaedlerella arabinosiphila]NDO67350.1 hypothetical protein [Schaedlerella arabinosiphila]